MDLRLKDKRILVTGSSGGIGQATAIRLASEGARVAVQYRSNEEGARKTLSQIGKDKDTLLLQGDVSKPDTVASWFSEIDRAWGGIDILVNNAGIDGDRQEVEASEIEDWEKVLSINLVGAYYTIRQALKRMVAQESGVILNMTSVHEKIPWAGHSAYCAAKAGLGILTQTLALEVADKNIRTLCLAPGAIQTDTNKDVWSDDNKLAALKTKIPMNRIGQVEEIANQAIALVSEATGSYMTGTTVFADGGMTAYPSFEKGG